VKDAEDLGEFLWQLSWRIPGLEKGTTLLTNDIPLRYYSDNSLTAALNWMYAPENHSLQMDYVLYYPTVRVGLALSAPERGLPIHQVYRAASFDGSTSRMLALYYAPPGCVHVLDVVLDDSMPNLPASLSAWVPLSRLSISSWPDRRAVLSRLSTRRSPSTTGATFSRGPIWLGSSAIGRPWQSSVIWPSCLITRMTLRNDWSSSKAMLTWVDWTGRRP
jgi:hypothetical protein